MRSTSVRELHLHTSSSVREAAEGAVILIRRRGEPVAELRPATAPAGDSTKIIEDDKSR